MRNDSNIHVGIRTTLSGPSDYENDGYVGFEIVEAREIDTLGVAGIIKKILDRVGTERPVYLSIDIDTLDPACKSFTLGLLYCATLTNQPASSCSSNRNPRDGWLVYKRAQNHSSGT